jgi:hypothetical protein
VSLPDWCCTSWSVQFAGERIVLGGAGSGYGRFAARIGAALSESQLAELREWAATSDVAEPGGLVVDIAAGFGATANEHPLLLPAALCYPGRALECPPEARIDLSACTVRVAPAHGRLVLYGGPSPDQPLLPVPHNATMPGVAPSLYRWLCRFGPSLGTTLAWWDHVDSTVESGGESSGVRCYPRLTLGRLVLCRRTWKVSPDALPDLAADPVVGMVAWRRWCAATGVPRRSFVRASTLPDPWEVVRGHAPDRRPSVSGSARKPIYVDLSQPLSWPLVRPGDTTLTFTEPLPDPLGRDPDDRVTEYLIETSQPRTTFSSEEPSCTEGW